MVTSSGGLYRCVSVPLRRSRSTILTTVHEGMSKTRAHTLIRGFHDLMPSVILHAAVVIKRPKRKRGRFSDLVSFVHRCHFRHLNTFTCSRRRKA